jgi:WXG100 family type VII secretion target
MDGQIRITPQQMNDRAKQFYTEGENFEHVVTNMTNLVNYLQEEWEGQSSASFKTQFESFTPGFNSVKELINDIAKQLIDTAHALETLDHEISSKIAGK